MPVRLVARPARLEMVTMRPPPAFFMPGATARANRKQPLRLASTMLAEVLGRDLFERLGPLAEDAARDIDQHVDPAAAACDDGVDARRHR